MVENSLKVNMVKIIFWKLRIMFQGNPLIPVGVN